MNDSNAIDLASLMCSRLCHDLLSPVGALTNGIELLAEETDPDMRERCFQLLDQSARTSAAKLKFFRLAYGAAGGFDAHVPVDEAREVIEALADNARRVTVRWALSVDSLPKPAIKVMLNLAHIALDALVRGGTLSIGAERRGSEYEVVVHAEGERLAFDATIGRALTGDLPAAELSGRTAPAFVIGELARRRGGVVQFHDDPQSLTMGATIPEGEGMIG